VRSCRPAPIRPSTSASIRICSTASATARRKSESPLFCSSSTSAILSSVIGSSVVAGGSRKSTVTPLPGDRLSLTRAPRSMYLGHYARRALTAEFPPRAPTLTRTAFVDPDRLRARNPPSPADWRHSRPRSAGRPCSTLTRGPASQRRRRATAPGDGACRGGDAYAGTAASSGGASAERYRARVDQGMCRRIPPRCRLRRCGSKLNPSTGGPGKRRRRRSH
jgi:hypothetical protein